MCKPENLERRQKELQRQFDELQVGAGRRRQMLEDSKCAFEFFSLCDRFEQWIRERLAHYATVEAAAPSTAAHTTKLTPAQVAAFRKLHEVLISLFYGCSL